MKILSKLTKKLTSFYNKVVCKLEKTPQKDLLKGNKPLSWWRKLFKRNIMENNLDKITFEHDLSFNRDTTLLSTGGLILSVGFIEKIIPISSASYSLFLYLGWLFFLLSLIINLTSFLQGSNFGFKLSYEKNNISDDVYNERVINQNKTMNAFNYSVFGSLVLGIILMLSFIFINLNNKTVMEKKILKDSKEFVILNEGFKHTLKQTSTVVIQNPNNIPTTITQTNDSLTIQIGKEK